ncbi:regenerating islet-derived protein 3-gamma-like [Sorex fumeus]|uniref:regenerating islet-derived protein 3-gamma-like n=1 Tax=Sorex fumeus TaxID=62283 RepID=UPI0024AE706C|nr:regenerating islet-derived protein 3-gamma-like [Sorex fumeus]XP_055994960.1 regenerating islet-derived protein 3-gamma-like [Sorex fumeus]
MLPPMATVPWLVLSCLVLQAHVKGEDLKNEELSPRVRCPKGSKAYGNQCYAFFKTAKSWMEAQTQPNAGGWEWSNGDLLNYQAWENGVPSNSGYCGAVLHYTGYEIWQNFDCRNVLPYVCKFEG